MDELAGLWFTPTKFENGEQIFTNTGITVEKQKRNDKKELGEVIITNENASNEITDIWNSWVSTSSDSMKVPIVLDSSSNYNCYVSMKADEPCWVYFGAIDKNIYKDTVGNYFKVDKEWKRYSIKTGTPAYTWESGAYMIATGCASKLYVKVLGSTPYQLNESANDPNDDSSICAENMEPVGLSANFWYTNEKCIGSIEVGNVASASGSDPTGTTTGSNPTSVNVKFTEDCTDTYTDENGNPQIDESGNPKIINQWVNIQLSETMDYNKLYKVSFAITDNKNIDTKPKLQMAIHSVGDEYEAAYFGNVPYPTQNVCFYIPAYQDPTRKEKTFDVPYLTMSCDDECDVDISNIVVEEVDDFTRLSDVGFKVFTVQTYLNTQTNDWESIYDIVSPSENAGSANNIVNIIIPAKTECIFAGLLCDEANWNSTENPVTEFKMLGDKVGGVVKKQDDEGHWKFYYDNRNNDSDKTLKITLNLTTYKIDVEEVTTQ